MFSVLFENGGMEDKRSNTLAYVLADLVQIDNKELEELATYICWIDCP